MNIPESMKAVVVKANGDVNALIFDTEHPVPKIAENQVLIKNEYAGLNFIDTYYRSGLYKKPCPFVPGQEGGGVIVAVGSGVDSNIQVGEKVVYIALVGSYCEYSAVPAAKVIKIPSKITIEKSLACMVQGLTAHYLVTDATAGLIEKDEWCLIYSVGSGTCQWAAQMAKLKGYKVIGTTSKTKAGAAPKACDHLIVLETAKGMTYADYESVDIPKAVMEMTGGQGVKLILDGVGNATSDISISCLARRGIWISFGNASGSVPPLSILKLTPKSAFCTREYTIISNLLYSLIHPSHDLSFSTRRAKIG
jgi:NADPH2:quinone reductase